jgi:hypothetical protein
MQLMKHKDIFIFLLHYGRLCDTERRLNLELLDPTDGGV